MLNDKEWRMAFKFVTVFFLFLLGSWTLIKLVPIITILIIAVLIVYSISPFVNMLIKRKLPPFIAAAAVSVLILFIIFLTLYLLVPMLLAEAIQLRRFFTTDFQVYAYSLLQKLQEIDARFNLALSDALSKFTTNIIEQIPYFLQKILLQVTSYSVSFVSRIWGVFGLLFVIFYLVQEMDRVKKNFTKLFPNIYHIKIGHVISVIDKKVGAYIRGNIVRCSVVGLLTWIALSLAGVPFALILGALAGVLNIILYIGPFLAAIPAIIISFTPAAPHPVFVIIIYVAVQAVDAFLLTPLLLGKAVDLSPLTIIIILLIGGQLMGILGIILAIPVTAVLKVLFFHYYLKEKEQFFH